jgi:hypothetical protein
MKAKICEDIARLEAYICVSQAQEAALYASEKSGRLFPGASVMKCVKDLARNSPNPYVREAATMAHKEIPIWFCLMPSYFRLRLLRILF